MPLMLENARSSLRHEPGCHQFDVCTDPSRPEEVFLYELYSDATAFDVHQTMPHFSNFNAAASDMIAEKTAQTYESVSQ